jgi:hypothetical protein
MAYVNYRSLGLKGILGIIHLHPYPEDCKLQGVGVLASELGTDPSLQKD